MKILIVGGGVAGLSLAIALKRLGRDADVVERQINDTHAGTGLYLPGNATRALGQLGLLERVQAAAMPVKNQKILDRHGRLLCNTDTENVWGSCGPCLALAHSTAHGLLRDAAPQSAIRYGVSIAEIRQAGAKCDVLFTDGTTGAYDLVVGADGINSRVRKFVSPSTVPAYSDQVSWRFVTRNATGIDCWTAMLGDGCTMLAIPLSPGQVYVYTDVTLPKGADHESMRHVHPRQLEGFTAPVFPLIERASDRTQIHFGRIGRVTMKQWVYGRVVLMGDAAHASSPSMAENAGMAMEDALVLAEVLATQADIDAALAAYEQRRQPRVAWVQKQCAARDRMRSLPSWARSGVLRLYGNRLYGRSYEPLLAQP